MLYALQQPVQRCEEVALSMLMDENYWKTVAVTVEWIRPGGLRRLCSRNKGPKVGTEQLWAARLSKLRCRAAAGQPWTGEMNIDAGRASSLG